MIIPNISRKTDTSITSIFPYGDPSFSAEVNTNILSLSTDYILSKGLNLLFLQRLDSYLKSSKFQFSSLLDLSSLYSFIFISFFVRFLVSSRYTKFLLYLFIVIFYVLCLFLPLFKTFGDLIQFFKTISGLCSLSTPPGEGFVDLVKKLLPNRKNL